MGATLLIGVVVVGLLAGLIWLLSSVGSLNQRLLFRLYERLGQRLYAHTDWEPLLAALPPLTGQTILDIGTATGSLPLTLAQCFTVHAVGIDWSPQLIATAKANAQVLALTDCVQFRVMDVRAGLPFADESFDGVLCLGVIETLADPEALIGQISRILKPGGWLVVSVYGRRWGTTAWYDNLLAPYNLYPQQISPFSPSYNILTCLKGENALC